MKLLNNMRWVGYKLLDGLKSDSVLDRVDLIDRCINDDLFYSKYIEDQLQNICKYASENTGYYNHLNGKLFKDFPVINKNIIMSDSTQFQSKEFVGKALHEMSTSGSTGRPFKIYQDSKKRNQVLAEVLYFSKLVGYRPGKKFVYLRNLESHLEKSKIKQFIQNETLIYTRKYDDHTLGDIVKEIISLENDTTILGYASTLNEIANYMSNNNITASNVSGIISGAEAITSKTRRLVEKQFNCRVVSRYSNQEMGILAQDYDEDYFLLNRASYYFELMDVDKDEPVEFGEVGRIVITDLYNHATPLIRYDTGDLGIFDVDDNGHIYLSKVMGRKLDLLYTTKDEPVSFFAIDEYFEQNYDIQQYQFIQEDRTHLIVNVIMQENKKLDEDWCIKGIKSVLGNDCNVEIKYLDAVPITASGKFRYVICNYKPEGK